MKFGKIDNLIILGGSYISIRFLKSLKKRGVKFNFFTSKRLLNDLMPNGISLKQNLLNYNLEFTSTENINNCKKFIYLLNKSYLILGFGEPWKLSDKLLKKVGNKFLDFMGIPMPEYRGGAHYSWMILNKNFKGGCFLQNVNKNTIQGYSDSGHYFMKLLYKYPKRLSIPNDYFEFSINKEINFLNSFITKLKNGKDFKLKKITEKGSSNFPRLNAEINGFIDWDYDLDELNRFINAFSSPYKGASTFYDNKRVYLKSSKVFKRNNFHVYCAGLIINIFKEKIYIAAKGGILVVNTIMDRKNNNFNKNLILGKRFLTPRRYIEKAKIHKFF